MTLGICTRCISVSEYNWFCDIPAELIRGMEWRVLSRLENHLAFLIVAIALDLIAYFEMIKRPFPKPFNTWGAMTSCHKSGTDLWESVWAALPCSCFLSGWSALPAFTDLMVNPLQPTWILSCWPGLQMVVLSHGVSPPRVVSFICTGYKSVPSPNFTPKPTRSHIHILLKHEDSDRYFQTTTQAPRFVARRGFTILLFLGILIPSPPKCNWDRDWM